MRIPYSIKLRNFEDGNRKDLGCDVHKPKICQSQTAVAPKQLRSKCPITSTIRLPINCLQFDKNNYCYVQFKTIIFSNVNMFYYAFTPHQFALA